MHNTRSDLVAIVSVALGKIPFKDLAPLIDPSYDRRTELQHELAGYLEEALLTHFEIKRRPMPISVAPMSGQRAEVPADLVNFEPKGWRGRR
ncbi:hypothetical protein [Mesorhizobium sp. 131-2-1]|uniref:hypothetical protein n=1 Tax=Mesorhizobium sp. 131-2-1 TaxID=2744518 RepID=UPI001927C6A3|nr:hypothetical protein [Mesorhizobium sp. 131-2-1]BCG96887.1 hypothetical protein MesoLj131a_57510 [Mesorhizobium sp. 131-2-1]